MATNSASWAIVLAAGEGSRLRGLTTDASGRVVPKQFCSFQGSRSLLGEAMARAARVVPKKRIVVVVADEQRSFWSRELASHPPENVVVQPRNRGTAAGVLLPLLHVLERDAAARLVLLPSDHHVQREYVIEAALRLALDSLGELDQELILLGIEPDAPDTGYGWIVPARSARILRPVARFVEKPDALAAAELLAQGALWNSFLLAADGQALLRLYRRRLPALLDAMRGAFAASAERATRLAGVYDELEARDFSRDLLEGSEEGLRLEVVPPCGWSDLGTPARVAACLARQQIAPLSVSESALPDACLDLALAVQGAARGPLAGGVAV